MKALTPIVAAASALFTTASAVLQTHCPVPERFCMSIGVPESTASSGSGTLYFQVQSVAASYSWVAIGTGTGMADSNIFVLYPDGSGNVTVSTRLGTGRTAPQPHSDTRFELLAGSGVEGGVLTANVACYSCESWEGGEMDLEGRSTAWIAAWREGSPLETASAEARISQHQGRDQFRMDLGSARLAQDANPFVTGAGPTDGGNGSGGSGGDGDAAGDGALETGNTGGASSAGTPVNMLLVHGVIMAVTFSFLYPLGAMMIPLVGKWYIHAGCQAVAFLAMWAGFATGYIAARNVGSLFRDAHTIFGTVIVSAMVLQPALGFLHHRHYLKHRSRSPASHAHICYGRLLLLLGVINGGVGLHAAGSPQTFTVVYAVAASVGGVAYIAAALVGNMRKRMEAGMNVKEGSVSPGASRQGRGDHGNPYGYQSRGESVRNQQYQFQSRDQGYGWTR